MRDLRKITLPLLLAAAAALVACGGGDVVPPKAGINRISVAGDSLADVGTFGFKFTVQNANDAAGYPIWTQLIANDYGLDGNAQCPYFAGNPITQVVAVGNNNDCSNFAVGGGRINSINPALAGSPYLVSTQLSARAALGAYDNNELLIVDGGGNDAADVVGAYLLAGQGQTASLQAMLASLLSTQELAALTSADPTLGTAVGAYMQKLAAKQVSDITSMALNHGAQRVLIMNAPDITLTPRFAAVLAGVAQASSPTQAATLKAGIQAWVGAFNTTLAQLAAGDARLAIVDFYADFNDEVANPSSYQLTNATEASCPVTGTDSSGLPEYTIPTCSDQALDATAGMTPGWWQRYAFSDGFHPTPYGHQLLAASVARALARAGWL